jgi:hypothetical protein
VKKLVGEQAHSAFQLVLCDGARTVVLRNAGGALRVVEWLEPVLVVTNEHAPGEFVPRLLAPALAPLPGVKERLDALQPLLADRGGNGHHAVCKRGDRYGTVSSSLLAVPAGDMRQLVWRYAPGPPDVTPYRNYGNLGRRLHAEPDD